MSQCIFPVSEGHLAQSGLGVEDDASPGDRSELGGVGSQLPTAHRPRQVTEEQRQALSGRHHLNKHTARTV